MAKEGVSAALKLEDGILKDLQTAQGHIEAMKKAADGLADGFSRFGTEIKNLAQGIKGSGVAFESAFDEKGAIRSIKLVAEAIQSTSKKASAVVKTEAQKAAEAAERAAKRAADADKRRQESMVRTASSLGAEAGNVLAQNPRGLEEMKQQLRQLNSLMSRLRAQSFKGNPFVDPAVTARVGSAIETLKGKISSAEARLRKINSTLNITSKNASAVKTMLASAFGPFLLQRFLSQMIKVRGEFEMAQRSLAVIIKDEGQAREMFNEITQMAVKSPFSVQELVKQTKQLAAYRIETDKLIETTKMLGDISAGVGVDMNRLILAYGQVKAAEFLKGTELRQFSEAGVNMLGGLADRFSEIYGRIVSVGEVMQMVSKRMVKFSDVEAVLLSETKAGGTFYKMQEKQAETLQGKIVNLQDRIAIMFNEIGSSYDGLMKKIISGLENLIANWKGVSNVLVPVLSGAFISGMGGLIKNTTLFKAISTDVKALNANLLKTSGALTVANRAGNLFRGTMSGIGKLIAANWLAVLAAVAAAIFQAYRNANQLRMELEKIESDARTEMEAQIQRYNSLLDIATDVTNTEQERQKALDTLKAEYGNILDIQKVELSNIQEMNNAREQQIELIRQQAYAEAKQSAMSAAVKAVQSQRKKQLKQIQDSGLWEGFILQYKEAVPGLALATAQEMEALMDDINKKILDGEITSAQEIRDTFLKGLLKRSGADRQTIDKIANEWGDNYLVDSFAGVFQKVIKQAKDLEGWGETLGVDMSVSRETQALRELIKQIEDVNSAFEETLTNEDKLFYNQNPAQKRINSLFRVEKYAETMRDLVAGNKLDEKTRKAIEDGLFGRLGEDLLGAIDSGAFQNMNEEMQKVLNREIEAAFRKAAPESEVDIWMLNLMSKLNKEFPDLKRPFQSGMVRWENGQDVSKFMKTIKNEIEEVEEAQEKLKNGNEREVLGIVSTWASPQAKTAEERIQSAKIALLQYAEALDRLQQEGGFFGRMTQTEMKQMLADIQALARDVINLADGWWKLTDEERQNEWQKIAGRAFQLHIEPPSDIEVQDIRDWLDNVVSKKLSPAANFDLKIAINKEAQKEIKDLSNDISKIFDDIVDFYKKNSADKLPKEVADLLLEAIQEGVDEFNKNPNKATTIELPVEFSLESLRAWIEANKENFTNEAFRDALLKLFETKRETNDNNRNRASQYKSDLKAFLSDLKNARKEMDKLNDSEDKLFVEKLQHQGKKVGVSIADTFVPTKEALDEIINTYLPKLDKADQLDLRLSWSKEDTADTIKEMTDLAARLWDKYDNAKKMEGWGFLPQEGSSEDTMRKIMELEQKLSLQNTEDATRAAEDIKKKRLEIARSEAEEAAKLMYEANKKALDKEGQAYKDALDDIARMRKGSNQASAATEEAINNRIKKAMNEIADAQWEAYKATDMYAMAIGNLDGLSDDVLKGLKADLEGWIKLSGDALTATEMRSVHKAIQKINEQLDGDRAKYYYQSIAKGFREISEARKEQAKLPELESKMNSAKAELLLAEKQLKEAEEAALQNNTEENQQHLRFWQSVVKAYSRVAQEETDKYNAALTRVNGNLARSVKRVSALKSDFDALSSVFTDSIKFARELADSLGLSFSDETEAGLAGFEKGLSLIGSGISLVSSAMTAWIILTRVLQVETDKLLMKWWPLLALMISVGTAVALLKAKDERLKQEIEAHKDNVEKLEKAYEKLEKAMDKALDLGDARQSYAEMNANLAKQRQELEEAIAANNQRKQNKDVVKETEDLKEQLDELDEKVEDSRDKWLEMLGAVTDYQGLARDWASDWLDAFKEAGDGLDSLKENFDELYDNLVVGQLWSKIMGPKIKTLEQMVGEAIGDGELTESEAAALRAFKTTFATANEDLKKLAESLGIKGGQLNGETLQRGVETITETTASALESILNATRYDVSSTNVYVANIAAALTGEGDNTILSNLRSQTRYLADIARIASAVYYPGGHPKGAGALKVITEMA